MVALVMVQCLQLAQSAHKENTATVLMRQRLFAQEDISAQLVPNHQHNSLAQLELIVQMVQLL